MQHAAGLPEGWRQSRTPTGRIYYLNDTTKTTQWEWPGLPGPPAALPSGWSQPSWSIQPSLRPPQQPAPPPPQRERPQSFFAVPALPAHHPQLAQAARSNFKVPAAPIFDTLSSPLPPPAQVKTEKPQEARSKVKVPAVPAFDSSEKGVGAALAAAAPLPLAPSLPPPAQVKAEKTEDDSDDGWPLAAKLERLAPQGAAKDARSQVKVEHGKEAHVIFVVDISASMKTKDGRNGSGKEISRMEAVTDSCLDFVRTHLKQEAAPGVQDLYSLVFFNDKAHVAVRRQLLSPALLRHACGPDCVQLLECMMLLTAFTCLKTHAQCHPKRSRWDAL